MPIFLVQFSGTDPSQNPPPFAQQYAVTNATDNNGALTNAFNALRVDRPQAEVTSASVATFNGRVI